ncbi:YchJ family protein [Desulfotalea psychrophila]|uniref:YchJ-like middle NTF2-like domain-containing protein n=1 Tax=Desulfotalea psychrophila (strain LSv54 / DSM 12343) TaxID=177439 RepID=Q6AK67_DESPS|nr:YchJ family metal-binding protein [Desulfotalea psychrophila]CAG37259.1 hypothetical protein DP2530 [Desulfotalea psychrophila LSv54]
MITTESTCPCGSEEPFGKCCLRIINNHSLAKTAEELMRSRYTAFVIKDNGYILKTWSKKTRPRKLQEDINPIQWIDLIIENTSKGLAEDTTGEVEFTVHFLEGKEFCVLHEKSRFRKSKNLWYYIDGDCELKRESLSLKK